jgi:hypothetical protein
MATSTMIAETNKMMRIFSVNMSNRFDEINANFTMLNACLANIECQCCPKAHETIAKELEEELSASWRMLDSCSSGGSKRRPPPPHLPILWTSW